MEIKIDATGGAMSGKTYILMRMAQYLRDMNFSVTFPGEKYDVPHEHKLVAIRSDDWVRENIVRK